MLRILYYNYNTKIYTIIIICAIIQNMVLFCIICYNTKYVTFVVSSAQVQPDLGELHGRAVLLSYDTKMLLVVIYA